MIRVWFISQTIWGMLGTQQLIRSICLWVISLPIMLWYLYRLHSTPPSKVGGVDPTIEFDLPLIIITYRPENETIMCPVMWYCKGDTRMYMTIMATIWPITNHASDWNREGDLSIHIFSCTWQSICGPAGLALKHMWPGCLTDTFQGREIIYTWQGSPTT